MTLLEKLEELEELKVCDEETVEALNIDSSLVEGVVEQTLTKYKELINQFPNSKLFQNSERMIFGSKLLFLEDLLKKDAKTQEKVDSWLEEEKRRFLFTDSNSGDIYGELLVAKAEENLEQYRSEFNPNSSQQPKFRFEKSLQTTSNLDTSTIEEGRIPVGKKVDTVLKRMENIFIEGLGYKEEKLYLDPDYVIDELINNSTTIEDERGRVCSLPQYLRDYYRELYDSGYISLEDHTQIGENEIIEFSINERNPNLKTLDLRKSIENVRSKLPNLGKVDEELMTNIRNAILSKTSGEDDENSHFEQSQEYDKLFKLMEVKYLGGYVDELNELNELSSLSIENAKINDKIKEAKKLSSKYKNQQSLTYSVELSEKDPLDIKFGNDSGCCVGIYDSSKHIGNGGSVPYYIADNATYIFNINQKRGEGKERRTGIVLAFESKDDLGNKVLACNSIELSPAMNPHSSIEEVVDFTEEALSKFAEENEFKVVLMSKHDYNTSYNYSKNKGKPPRREETLKKVSPKREADFYSEIVNGFNGEIDVTDNSFYVIYNKRRIIKPKEEKKVKEDILPRF